ncbi:hypothetical protein MKEN_00801300 [Mycena kentingensis (nom. inval.)]|nr:hypothetical protein MKEN_00801300 [Mycena kentingensis (nom. inval.)]
MSVAYVAFVAVGIGVLKVLNEIVDEPYMDEPFHIPQAQAYCRGEFNTWDPKLTTPPGLYLMTLLLKKMFMLKCNISQLRLTTILALLVLPLVLSRLLCFHQRGRLPKWTEPSLDALVLACFPIAWFFGFLYYTEVPSLMFVVATIVAAMQGQHWMAALLGAISCTFRQTNVVWVLYAYAMSQLMFLRFRFRRVSPGAKELHDPPALEARPGDLAKAIESLPGVLGDILPAFVPYALVLALFVAFVVWNGGIVLGDKSNHIPTLHIPQFYYFFAFSTAFGWPVLISGQYGAVGLVKEVGKRMFGSNLRILSTVVLTLVMAVTVNLFTIHHPFLLSDNRHYTFYVWHRIYMRFLAPYLLVPIYIACGWAWSLRVAPEQTMLQTMLLPIFVLPTLLPTPLLEPRYFLIPYILMRAQIAKVPTWSLLLEGVWYAGINAATILGHQPHLNFVLDYRSSTGTMSNGGSSTPPPFSKPSRGSIRHSLGLASKALAAIGKEKDSKPAKDSSRRLSAVDSKPNAPRASLGDVGRPSSIASRRTTTPDQKTVTRRRVSAAALKATMEDQPPDAAPKQTEGASATVTRSASLRPRPGVSALPKYRPRSIVGDAQLPKAPSPARAGVRRRLVSSDDEKDEEEAASKAETAAEKSMRPISPLPQRAALKVNLTSAINAASPPVGLAKSKAAPSKPKDTPSRPTKTVKTAASATSSGPRPSSSASSSSSFTPRTPKSTNAKTPAARRADKAQSNSGSPLRDSPLRSQTDSPLARLSKKPSSQLRPPTPPSVSNENEVGNMSHISEANSEDEDAEDVALLLAPVASLHAPTPAMPRTVSSRRQRKAPPQTPTRSQLPSRANLSYLSPLPPAGDSPPSLRPKPVNSGANVPRGSILSWEQLAEASRSLGQEEIAHMLSEMPAPFRAGAISPPMSQHGHDVPESPCLSAMNSPGEFGSISQVLLPEVTPSPAVHANHSRLSMAEKDLPAVDAAVVTLLRLQLASAESIGKERLFQMQAMEEEIHNLKQARMRDADELRKQVGDLEYELRGNLELRQRADEDRSAQIASLEDQLRDADASRVIELDSVVEETRATTRAEANAILKTEKAKTSAVWGARVAGTQWAFVKDFAESEMETIKGEREVLSALLTQLDVMRSAAIC